MTVNDLNYSLQNNKIQKDKLLSSCLFDYRTYTNELLKALVHLIESLNCWILGLTHNNSHFVNRCLYKQITLQYKLYFLYIYFLKFCNYGFRI